MPGDALSLMRRLAQQHHQRHDKKEDEAEQAEGRQEGQHGGLTLDHSEHGPVGARRTGQIS